jgi:hypothetical protein
MEYAVKLSKLPADFVLNQRLQERVRYDAARGELIYRGFMTKCMYDELSALSDDAEYHRALERLFVLTSADAQQVPQRRIPAAALVATIGVIAIAAGAIWVSTREASAEKTAAHGEAVAVTAAAK